MPLVGIKCPKHGQLSFEEALTGKCDCVPRFLYDSIIDTNKRDYHKGNLISPTSLLGCLRETYLVRTYPYYATLSQLYYSWRGTLIHSVFNRPNLDNWISEQRYKKTIAISKKKTIDIEGTIDGYDKLTKILWDIKTIGDRGIDYVIKDGAKEEHEQQLNIYRWLLPYEIVRMRIIYITMMSFAQTGQINETRQRFKYAPDQKKKGFAYIRQLTKEKSGFNEYAMFYETPEVPMWGEKETKMFIIPRVKILKRAFEKDDLPSRCDKKLAEWKCNPKYCQVYDLCFKCDEEKCEEEE